MGKRARKGVKPAVTTTVNPAKAKVEKGRRGPERAKKAEKKRNNVKTRSTTKQSKKLRPVKAVATFLKKTAAIQATSNERRVLTKVFNFILLIKRFYYAQIYINLDSQNFIKETNTISFIQ